MNANANMKLKLAREDVMQMKDLLSLDELSASDLADSKHWEQHPVERQAALALAFGKMPRQMQNCMTLYFRDFLSISRIASIIGYSHSTVRLLLMMGIDIFSEALGEEIRGIPNELRPARLQIDRSRRRAHRGWATPGIRVNLQTELTAQAI